MPRPTTCDISPLPHYVGRKLGPDTTRGPVNLRVNGNYYFLSNPSRLKLGLALRWRFALEPLRIYFLIYPYDGFYVQEVASCFQMFLETILIPQKPITR